MWPAVFDGTVRDRYGIAPGVTAEKLAEFGTFSGKFHACLVCG